MTDPAPQKKKITRSPAYPALSLREAIEKASLLYEKEKRHPAPLSAIESHFGFKVGGGTVSRVISALGKFGLVDDEGQLAEKQYKLSEAALTIILSPANSPERSAAIKTAALLPAIYRDIWDLYGGELPSNETLKSYLLLKRGFNPGFVDDFIETFRDTIDFSGLLNDVQGNKTPPAVEEKSNAAPSENAVALPSGLNAEVSRAFPELQVPISGKNKMLAQYSIPLGANQATLVFTGQELTAADFDDLKDYVDLFKKQFERAGKITVSIPTDKVILGDRGEASTDVRDY